MNPSSTFSIETIDVGKRFGAHWVLRDLNLQVRRGESVALFGNNGSGKSTLIRMIAALLSPTTGSLQVLGYDVGRQRMEIRKKIRVLGHAKQLYGSLTVLENLKFAAGMRGLSVRNDDAFLISILEKLGIDRFRNRPLCELSEGMKKRTVLAKLLLGDAELILLDEPHPTLDVEGRALLNSLIVEWRKKGTTLLLASHDHAQVLVHVDRVLTLEKGGFL